jgi:hypothetical protein
MRADADWPGFFVVMRMERSHCGELDTSIEHCRVAALLAKTGKPDTPPFTRLPYRSSAHSKDRLAICLSGVGQPLQFGRLAQHDETGLDVHRAALPPLTQLLVHALAG